MPVWVVTGKLGAGKSVHGVTKALEYLRAGKPVATNVDLQPDKVMGAMARYKLIRLPDFPMAEDLWALESGNDTTDEEKNGLLLLDEGAFLLNARSWAAAGREKIIEWFLMSRKFGWDVILLIQTGGALDKQLRESIGEHQVVCRRMDRIKVPVLSTLMQAVGMKGTFPKVFVGSVHYGMAVHAPVVDRWWAIGSSVFAAFPTKQIYKRDAADPVATHCVLDAYTLHGRYLSDWEVMKKRFYVLLLVTSSIAGVGGWLGKTYVAARAAPAKLIEKSEIIGYVQSPGGMAVTLTSGESFTAFVWGIEKGLVYAERGGIRYTEIPRTGAAGGALFK